MTSFLVLIASLFSAFGTDSPEARTPAVDGAVSLPPVVQPFRMDPAYVSAPSGWKHAPGASTPTRLAYRRGDGYLAFVGAYTRGEYEPSSEAALTSEIDELVRSVQESEPQRGFENEEPVTDVQEDIHRVWMDARAEENGEAFILRYVISYDPRVDRFLFTELQARESNVDDLDDVDARVEDIVWWFELDAFDPDESPDVASFE